MWFLGASIQRLKNIQNSMNIPREIFSLIHASLATLTDGWGFSVPLCQNMCRSIIILEISSPFSDLTETDQQLQKLLKQSMTDR